MSVRWAFRKGAYFFREPFPTKLNRGSESATPSATDDLSHNLRPKARSYYRVLHTVFVSTLTFTFCLSSFTLVHLHPNSNQIPSIQECVNPNIQKSKYISKNKNQANDNKRPDHQKPQLSPV